MEIQVSEKSTKAEILKAYESLLKGVQQANADVPKNVQEEKCKKEVIAKVADTDNDSIVKNIAELKTALNTSLDVLLQRLTSEFRRLEDIRAAIIIEKKTLEDLYSLSANTDSLAAMLLANREKKESFEREMSEQKALWEQEKVRQKTGEKEYSEELAKQRKREEEEYQYNLKIKRQKEQDEFDNQKLLAEKAIADKKAAFEKEFSDREQSLQNAESELAELRKTSSEFPAKLETALNGKEAEITQRLQSKYDFDLKLFEKQTEAEIKLKEQMISSLQEKIKEQHAQIKEYADKAARAESGMKDIAVKALESATKKMYKEDNS